MYCGQMIVLWMGLIYQMLCQFTYGARFCVANGLLIAVTRKLQRKTTSCVLIYDLHLK